MPIICNPININYRYQFQQDYQTQAKTVNREAADPSLIFYKDRYYIFASMTLGVWVSDDLAHWENHPLPASLPLYDYAPDVRVINDRVVICASRRENNCNYYCTQDILNGPYEMVEGSFPFWDPNLFQDDDGRVYFYWGCANTTPIYGVELDPVTFLPMGERRELIYGDPYSIGFERIGEDHCQMPLTEEEIDVELQKFAASRGMDVLSVSPEMLPMIRAFLSRRPYIEGAWMTKHDGRYYLQYAFPGTEFNIYGDGVYVSDSPLGPFTLARNNPYSYHPGGFLPGAGHGSTERDKNGCYWHTATMRISINHPFERRVGLWKAGFDSDGELFCDQRYGDWPMRTEFSEPWAKPEWMLQSYGKKMSASSSTEGHEPEKAADENVQTWWQAASAEKSEWLCMDLGEVTDVRAIQINFADDKIDLPSPGLYQGEMQNRYIDGETMYTRWLLEGSADGINYEVIEDKSKAETDLSHDLIVREKGIRVRYLKLHEMEVPYGQKPCISGLRVFGFGNGKEPEEPTFQAVRTGDLDFEIRMEAKGAAGFNILWGYAPDKLYHSYMTFRKKQKIGALVKDRNYYVRVDAFNEKGITEGTKIQKI